jgi:hypothetical protein
MAYGNGMDKTPHGWNIFDAKIPILTYSYSFGPGVANALAVGAKGGLVVVSPPCHVDSGVMDDLSRIGKVRALVASNAFHLLGLPEWKARFPEAALYAPAQAVARVERKTKLFGIRPLAEAQEVAGSRVELIDMPHYKTGEVLVRVNTDRGDVWYVTDIVMNLPELPKHFVPRMAFALTRSGPGMKVNNIAPLFMVRDKKALKRWLGAEVDKAPPSWVIFAHGTIADVSARPQEFRRLFN